MEKPSRHQLNQIIEVSVTVNNTSWHHEPLDKKGYDIIFAIFCFAIFMFQSWRNIGQTLTEEHPTK